ncbi:MAG: flavodoxin-like domain-containing protein [Candidatus Heimdallarchaeota archaeon]|nr:MAG: flavodoxin-like domain-containing protein [Candidatus Heimdallarchaeota archaeon]
MVRALILYHSLFGNTKDVAISLATGIEESGVATECLSIDEIDINQIAKYDFLAIGGPTHMIGLSKAMKVFLKTLESVNLNRMKGFSFDTRNHSRLNKKRWFILENSAARRIEAKMKKMGITIIKPRQSAIVYGREGPLESNVEPSFQEIGTEIGNILIS